MGFETVTEIKCTKPDLVGPGSEFNTEWADQYWRTRNGAAEYVCRKYYILESLEEYSKKYSEETFTANVWRTDDIEDCEEWKIVYKDGEPIEYQIRPKYNFMSQVGYNSDKDFTRLVEQFTEHVEKYFQRLDRIKEKDDKGNYLDILNDQKDENGFSSFYVIYWENDQYRFRAKRRYNTMVIIDFERKESGDDDDNDNIVA